MIVSTLMVTVGALVIALPIGLGVAAYLSDVAHWRVREVVKPVVEILAGIPSVVVGFLGIVLFGPAIAKIFHIGNGLNALNGSMLLAIMALPTIISISEDSLNAVPPAYCRGVAGPRRLPLADPRPGQDPGALSGIIAAFMLGMGRAIGETMTVLMATGNARAFPHGLPRAVRTMTANIAIELGEVPYYTTHYYALFAIGLVLFMMTFVVNLDRRRRPQQIPGAGAMKKATEKDHPVPRLPRSCAFAFISSWPSCCSSSMTSARRAAGRSAGSS